MSVIGSDRSTRAEPNEHGYRALQAGRVHVQPRRVLRLRRRGRPASTSCRPTPSSGAPARRRLGVLLRHRQLRRRGRHGQPLRDGRPVRRPLQRRLPQGRARPPRELRDAADQGDLRGDARRLDQRGLRPLRRADRDRLRVRRQARRQPGGDHPPPRHRRADGRRPRRRGPAHRRQRPSGQPAVRSTSARTSPRSTPSPASRTRSTRSTCSPTCRARRSPGTRRSCRSAATACTARRPRSTSCRSSTATTASSGSSSCPTRSLGRRGPRHRGGPRQGRRCGPATSPRCRPTSATRATRPKRSMLLVWENADPELPGLISSGQLPSVPGRVLIASRDGRPERPWPLEPRSRGPGRDPGPPVHRRRSSSTPPTAPTFETLNPHDGSVIAERRRGRPGRRRPGRRRRGRGVPGLARTGGRRPAAGCCCGWPT